MKKTLPASQLPILKKATPYSSFWRKKYIVILLLMVLCYVPVHAQTYNFTAPLDLEGGGFGINTISGNYTEGSNDVLFLTNTESGTGACGDPELITSGNGLQITGCGIGNVQDVNKLFQLTKVSGSAFKATSMIVHPQVNPGETLTGVVITGYNGVTQTGTFTINNLSNTGNTSVDFTSQTGFDNVTQITISVPKQDLFINNLVLVPAAASTTINSIADVSAANTNAATVQYTVTFGAAVTGLTASNFSLTTTGSVSGASVALVSGSGSTYTVTVNTGTGDGTIGLNLANATGLSPGISTTLPFAGNTYTIDHTPPTLTSGSYFSNNGFSSQYAKVGDQITLSIGYNEPLQSLTMTIDGNPVSVTPSNGNKNWTGVYTTTSADVEGNVPWTLSATDLAGNVRNYANTDFGTVLIFDKTPPAVTSITAIGTNPTNASSLTYTVTFSESVTGVDAADFTITTTNNPALTTTGISSITGSGNTYTVTIGGVTGDGTVRLDLNGSGTGITDIPGNPIGGGFTTGAVYTIDHTPPAADPASEIFVSSNANVRAAKVGDVITLSFTTTEPIQTPAITIDGHSVTASNLSGNNWSVNYTMTSSDTEGPVSFDVQAADLAGNTVDISSAALPPQFVITFDKTNPTISISAPSVATINSGTGSVTYTVTYADANFNAITLVPGNITLNTTGDATGTVSVVNSTSSSVVTIAGITGSGSIGISIGAGTANDVAGNSAPAAGASATFAVVLNTENITFNALPIETYGDTDFAPGATSDNNGPAITYTSDNPLVATIVTGNIHIVGAGSANITASQAGDATHSAAIDQIQPLTVNAAPLTITADNQSKVYGAAIPALTASYTGFVNGDTPISLTVPPTITTTATAASSVAGNPYAITASGAVDANYIISYVPGIMTIGQAPLTITADNQSKVYGAAIPALTASYTGFVNGDTPISLTVPPTITTTATAASSVAGNPYAITASGAVDANYIISYVPGLLTVGQAPLTITADNQTKVYGAAIPTLTASYTGLVNGDTPISLTVPPTITTTATAASSVAGNPYAITASGAVDANYIISYVPGILTIGQAPLTITADNQTKVYGAAIPTLTASYAGFVNGDTPISLTVPPTITTTATAASQVAGNPYAITASGAVDANYIISYVPGLLTVGQAPLTITADNQSKVYGDAIPTLTASYTGFVNGDTGASLTTLPTLSTTATAASSVAGNPYAITASGAVDPNYSISYVAGSLNITSAALTITADNQTKAYGAGIPILTASYSGFVNGDTPGSLTTVPTLTTTATAASHVAGSPYAITASGAVDPDYTISYVAGNLTIGTAPLTITADNQSKAYGDAIPTLTASYAGFVNGDTQASLTTPPTITTTATAASTVAGNPYAITASGAADADYTISYVDGTLTVNAAPLTITADNQNSTYGQALPALTVSYAGFVNGDTRASLTTAATASTTATGASPAGSYTITPSGAVDNNYSITYTNGTLTIGQAALTITADNQNSTYGQALPALTVSYAGFVNGDTRASLTTAATAGTTATGASPAGSYTITPSGAVDNNYSITYTNGTLTIGQAALTITADNQAKAYGAAIPTLTATYSGFVNGDNAGNLTTAPTLTTTATAASHVAGSPYAITASGAVDNNYTISYVPGNLTIGAAALTITADNQAKAYGAALPALTATYSGFVNGDTQASLSTAPMLTTTATAASPVNTYPVTASGAADADYTISYTNGTLTIGQAALTITADNQNSTYGQALPALTVSYAGFVNGDTQASLTTAATASTTATGASPAGSYTITPSGAVDNNYSITYTNGTLTIGQAALTITANNQTKTAGTANPPLTVSYTGFVNGDTNTNLATQPVVTTTATTSSPAGPYPVTVSGAADANYTISYVAGTLTVTPASSTGSVIAFAPIPQKTYGNTDFAPGATSNNNVTPVTYSSDNTAVATIVSGKVHIVGAGTANITAMQAAGGTFTAAANVIEQLNVVPSALTITANNQTKTAGTANPALTVSYTGFVNGDTNTNLTTQPVVTTTAITSSPAGPYPITASGATDANYTISYVAGTLTVTPASTTASTIAFAPIPQQTYGNTDFAPGATSNNTITPVTYSSDNTAVATIVSGKVHIVGAGTANITAMQAAGGTFTAASNVTQQLKVVPEAITVTANAESKTFGQPDPALTYAVTAGALVGTDAFTGALTRVAGEATGTYAIKQGTLALSSNYTLTYIGASLTITQKTLTITANNATKVYGTANPALTVSYSGFVNGDTQASLSTQPTISTTAVTSSGANTYPVTVSGAAIAGYTIVYVPGTLTVTKAVLTVTADNQTRNYGEANPELSVAYSGFVNGDDVASLTSPAVAATTATTTTVPGSYPITVNGAVSANYSFNYVAGTLVIKPLTNANLANLTLSSGILTPGFDTGTLAYTSFVENSADQITLTPTLSDATATVKVNGTLTASGTSSADIPLAVGSNVITVEVTAQDGITKLDYTVTVTRDESILAITATNILTPNGDGKNDTWVIQDIQHYPNNSVTVYDRAGRTVYTKNGYANDWGGTLNGVPLNEGTYYYVVNLGPGLRTFKGFISILRSN